MTILLPTRSVVENIYNDSSGYQIMPTLKTQYIGRGQGGVCWKDEGEGKHSELMHERGWGI